MINDVFSNGSMNDRRGRRAKNERVKNLFDVIAIEKWICVEQQNQRNENENSVTELCHCGDDMNVSWRGFYVSGR